MPAASTGGRSSAASGGSAAGAGPRAMPAASTGGRSSAASGGSAAGAGPRAMPAASGGRSSAGGSGGAGASAAAAGGRSRIGAPSMAAPGKGRTRLAARAGGSASSTPRFTSTAGKPGPTTPCAVAGTAKARPHRAALATTAARRPVVGAAPGTGRGAGARRDSNPPGIRGTSPMTIPALRGSIRRTVAHGPAAGNRFGPPHPRRRRRVPCGSAVRALTLPSCLRRRASTSYRGAASSAVDHNNTWMVRPSRTMTILARLAGRASQMDATPRKAAIVPPIGSGMAEARRHACDAGADHPAAGGARGLSCSGGEQWKT